MSTPLSRPNLLTAISLFAISFAFVTSTLDAMLRQSADLYALWLAGEFMAMGQTDQIYPVVGDVFTMSPPSAWWPHAALTDDAARIFPFIYPPLWASLMSAVTQITSFRVFDSLMLMLNQGLLLASVACAARMCASRHADKWLICALTYAVLVLCMPIGIALSENQPQILVSFLIVFAFERAQFGRLRTAGALLALAASIKLYPLLFVVIFLARRQWAALGAFVVVGAALAAVSVALAGWPLHGEYLHLIDVLTSSVIVTNFSFSLDAFVATGLFSEDLITVKQPNFASQEVWWSAVAKTPLWVSLSAVTQVLALVVTALLAARRPNDPLVMPFAAILFAMLSPLSWAYTYLTAFVFLGFLAIRLGRMGWIPMGLFAAAFLPLTAAITLDMPILGTSAFVLSGAVVILVMGATVLWAIIQGCPRAPAPILPT